MMNIQPDSGARIDPLPGGVTARSHPSRRRRAATLSLVHTILLAGGAASAQQTSDSAGGPTNAPVNLPPVVV